LDADGLILLKNGSAREKDQIDVAALTRVSRRSAPLADAAMDLSLDDLRRNPPPASGE
jgi:hypothetical protein